MCAAYVGGCVGWSIDGCVFSVCSVACAAWHVYRGVGLHTCVLTRVHACGVALRADGCGVALPERTFSHVRAWHAWHGAWQ